MGEELIPFADHIVQIINNDIPQGCETNNQMVGPSQDLVNLDINLTRASGLGDVSPQKPKSRYALLLNPVYNVNAKKQKKNSPSTKSAFITERNSHSRGYVLSWICS